MPDNLYDMIYKTPASFDNLLLESDGEFLFSVSFVNGTERREHQASCHSIPVLEKTKEWLDMYFEGKKPDSLPPFRLFHATPFQTEVYQILLTIPYGTTMTYQEIANVIAKNHGIEKMSSQAVGQAVSKNPLCILVPCHRVIGKGGTLVGYSGGMKNKILLLEQEGVTINPKEKKKYDMRCSWCNLDNPLYVKYHDEEWGKEKREDRDLFEALSLEIFQTGLSFECILNKREALRTAFDDFEPKKVAEYKQEKVNSLILDSSLIRHQKKIEAIINNARVFLSISEEYGGFFSYLDHFTGGKRYQESGKVYSELSDHISKDLKDRGMNFVGTKVIYSYLQAIGIVSSHEKQCFLYQEKSIKVSIY